MAFTAAHCSEQLGAPVMLADDPGAGVVGTVVARNEVLDYSVVALNGRAVPVRQTGVNGRGGAPAFGDVVCKAGLATGYSCGSTPGRLGASSTRNAWIRSFTRTDM